MIRFGDLAIILKWIIKNSADIIEHIVAYWMQIYSPSNNSGEISVLIEWLAEHVSAEQVEMLVFFWGSTVGLSAYELCFFEYRTAFGMQM